MRTIVISMSLMLLLFLSCKKQDGKSEDIDAYYEISMNESFQLELPSNPSTGYAWEWTNRQFTFIIDTLDCCYIPDTPVLLGSGGKEKWNFKAKCRGMATIKLEYCKSWESGSAINSKEIFVMVK